MHQDISTHIYYTPERLVMILMSGQLPEERQLLSGLMTLQTDLGAESIHLVADEDRHDHQH